MALEFDSASSITTQIPFVLTLNETVCFWLKMNSLVGNQDLFGVGNKWLGSLVGNQLNQKMYKAGGSNLLSVQTLVTDRWYHVAMEGNKTTGDAVIVIDGNIDNSVTNHTANQSNGNLSIGQFDGIMDDFRVYDRNLSMAEVQTIMNARGTDGIQGELALRYLFNESSAGTSPSSGSIRDVSVGGYDASPSGSPLYVGSELKFRRRVA